MAQNHLEQLHMTGMINIIFSKFALRIWVIHVSEKIQLLEDLCKMQ